MTSEELAGSVNTNPVVIRRIVSALQHAGLVATVKGARGGVKLAAPAERVSLRAVYRALEAPPSLTGHRQKPNPRCPVGRKIEVVLDEVFASAQTALEEALSQRTVADVIETISDECKSGTRAKPVRRHTSG